MCKFSTKLLIGYLRVSTDKQKRSGLGLKAQAKALQDYAKRVDGCFLKIYQEVVSGRNNNRLELKKALAHAKRSGATLVVAKLDRLSRNAHFITGLMESKVKFVFCDFPEANELTIHILAAVAAYEAKLISERTKAGMQAYKREGGLLGAARMNGYQFSYGHLLGVCRKSSHL